MALAPWPALRVSTWPAGKCSVGDSSGSHQITGGIAGVQVPEGSGRTSVVTAGRMQQARQVLEVREWERG